MRTPLVPKVSLRCMAAKMDSRVFSSAHTPPRPAVLIRPIFSPTSFFPLKRASGVASKRRMATKIIALAVARCRVVRVAGTHNSHLVRVVPAAVLHGQAVLPGLADVAAVDFGSPFHSAQKVRQ